MGGWPVMRCMTASTIGPVRFCIKNEPYHVRASGVDIFSDCCGVAVTTKEHKHNDKIDCLNTAPPRFLISLLRISEYGEENQAFICLESKAIITTKSCDLWTFEHCF